MEGDVDRIRFNFVAAALAGNIVSREGRNRIATAASAGRDIGRATFHQIPRRLRPSMVAASSTSFGRATKYWRIRKVAMLPCGPNTGSRISGTWVSISPSHLKKKKFGMMVTSSGTISAETRKSITSPAPAKRSRASA